MPTDLQVPRIDLRPLPRGDRHGLIVRTFLALAPGESLVLVNDHDPRPLLYKFQFEHAGAFEWFWHEEGPEAWVAEIARRTGPWRRGVAEYRQAEHQWLDDVFGRICEGDERASWLPVYAHGLRRHLRLEEEHLAPTYQLLAEGRGDGPMAVMDFEHDQIRALLDELVAAPDARFDEQVALLLAVLGPHSQKEEQYLYPTIDRLLGPDEAHALVLRMQAA